MIKVKREGSVLKFIISTSVGWTITAEKERNSELDAILLHDSILQKLGDTIEELRREEYENGWSDKRKRNIKQTSFKRLL